MYKLTIKGDKYSKITLSPGGRNGSGCLLGVVMHNINNDIVPCHDVAIIELVVGIRCCGRHVDDNVGTERGSWASYCSSVLV